MKFNRLPVAPRPLETFHFADEKQPRITFTKYTGILRSRGGGLIPPSQERGIQFYASFFFKKDRDNPRCQTKTGGAREREGGGRNSRTKGEVESREGEMSAPFCDA